jgi:hypothetical protein
MKLRWLLGLGVSVLLHAQVIEFESNGLRYKTLTKGSMTVMFAYLPPHVKDFSIVQVSISNGSPVSWTVKPEDFTYRRQDGGDLQASPAIAVVNSLLAKSSRHDVIKLVTTYENQLYGNIKMQVTNGYERRREDALAVGMPIRFKAGAAAAAIALVSTKLGSGESTDGAVFFVNGGRLIGPGIMIVHTGGEIFEFPSEGEPTRGLESRR